MRTLRRLYAKLRLRVNEAKSAVARPWGRKFLGYSFWVAKGGEVRRRVAPAALEAMKDRVRAMTGRNRGRSLEQVSQDLRGYLVGWREYYRLADTPGVFRDLDKWVRHRLRVVHLKQWKRGRTVYRELRARGLSQPAAACVARHTRRWWWNASRYLHVALTTRYFDGLGVPRLAT